MHPCRNAKRYYTKDKTSGQPGGSADGKSASSKARAKKPVKAKKAKKEKA